MRPRWHLVALCLIALAAHAGAQSAPPWTDMGGGLAGTTGIPLLEGTGDLVAGTPGSIKLSGGAPSAPCMLFFSLLKVDVPFKGGTLSAFPPMATFTFVSNPSGGLLLPWSSWSSVLPPGLELYFQMALKDAGGVNGASISNLLQGITQP